MISVLFVCLGNICRSPMAEGVFAQLIADANLQDKIRVDSAGTAAYHEGERAHRGTRRILSQHHIAYDGRARQVTQTDMQDSRSWVVAMDYSNKRNLENVFGTHSNVHLLLTFAQNYPQVEEVPDPYYTGNFEYVYQLVRDGCEGLLAAIRQQEGI